MANIAKLIYDWQNLIGAFLGAAAPIFFWFYMEFHNKRKKRFEDLDYLKRVIATSISTVESAYMNATNFTDNVLEEFIMHVRECYDVKSYAAHTISLPQFYIHTINEDIAKINIDNLYLEDKIATALMSSRDFVMMVDDYRNELKSIIDDNKLVVINHLNPPRGQCTELIFEIEEYRDDMKKVFIGQGIPQFLKSLFTAYVTIDIMTLVEQRWKFRLVLRLKSLSKRERYRTYREKFYENYIETRTKEAIKEFNKRLSTKRRKNKRKIHMINLD
ncbi:MAG: hypothetical protein WCQ96_02265 [Patescibacteria group bacterium]